jgi:nucleoside-diphosphate-sugar epimerase
MRAIVTGGAGFIGSHLVARLWDWDVEVVDDLRSGGQVPSDVRLHQVPVHRAQPHPHPDVIFHLAGPVGPVGVLSQAGSIVTDIIRDAQVVRSWALFAECPLVYVSTSEVYGSGGIDSESDSTVFAADTSARKEYAVAKLAAETMLRNTAGLDVRIVRPFNVAGPGQRPDGGFVLPRFIAQAKANQPLTVYAPGTQRRAFTHVADIAEGLLLAYEKGKPGEVYNLGNPDNACSIRQLALEVIEATASHSNIELVDPTTLWGPAFREAPDKLPVATKAANELGWYPTRDRRTTICDAIG